MEVRDKVVVVTGAGSGIGKALADRFVAEGARTVVRVDIAGTDTVVDVSDAAAVEELVRSVEAEHGPIDLYCSNAGIGSGLGIDADDETWRRVFEVNVMGSVNAARALLPTVRARGEGYLLITASAAGLLTNLGDAPYTVTKHGAVGLAEWLRITHGDEGLRVSCLCPQGVNTPLLSGGLQATPAGGAGAAGGTGGGMLATDVVKMMGVIEPEAVADAVIAGLAEERFLILPHPEVAEYVVNKATNIERWIGGMRSLQRRLLGQSGGAQSGAQSGSARPGGDAS